MFSFCQSMYSVITILKLVCNENNLANIREATNSFTFQIGELIFVNIKCERLRCKSGLKHKRGLYCWTESNDMVNICHITQHSPRYIQRTLREACLILKLAGICLNTCSRFVNSCSFVSRCIYSEARCLAIGDTLSSICWDIFTSSKGQEL